MAPALLGYLGFGATPAKTEEKGTGAVRALPANWYTSPEMYELERRAIFSRKWILVTHQLRLKEPGDFLRFEIAGFDFVVTKDRTGTINAFHNVCRHRAYPVVEAQSGSAKILSCRYHGWSYGLNGKLAKAPGYQDLSTFDKAQNNLFPIHVKLDKRGFVFVNLDSAESPEETWAKGFDVVENQERFNEFDFSNYEFDHEWGLEANYNWKIASDNYNECYHCKTTHPDVPDLANLETYDVQGQDGHIVHDAGTTDQQRANGLRIASTYYFPNSSMTVTPHFFFTQQFFPTSPTTTNVRYNVYRNKYSAEEDFQRINQMYKRIMSEDKVLCDRAQRNLNAGIFINGELHPKMEKGPLYFQAQCRESVFEHHAKEKKLGKEIWPAKQKLPTDKSGEVAKDDEDFCSGLACSTGREEGLAW